MPEVSRFFGIVVRMYYDDHDPPHLHAEYQGRRAVIDFEGNVTRGSLESRTAVRLLRTWIDLRRDELVEDWTLARRGEPIRKIAPLD